MGARLQGRCPSCGSETLFYGSQGYVTCSLLGCKDPLAAHRMLASPASAPTAPEHQHQFKYDVTIMAMVCRCGFRITEYEAYNAYNAAAAHDTETPS